MVLYERVKYYRGVFLFYTDNWRHRLQPYQFHNTQSSQARIELTLL